MSTNPHYPHKGALVSQMTNIVVGLNCEGTRPSIHVQRSDFVHEPSAAVNMCLQKFGHKPE